MLDLGLGRSVRPLGPLSCHIDAPRDVVFGTIAAPYLGRTTRALETKLRVLERGTNMVLAEHYSHVGPIVATTVETVRFDPPSSVSFRLVRGPVPEVAERFELDETDGDRAGVQRRGRHGSVGAGGARVSARAGRLRSGARWTP